MTSRNHELANQVLADLADMNVGLGTPVPIKTVWLRHMTGGVTAAELTNALEWGAAPEQNYWILHEGGIAGMGSVVLTDKGYEHSRSL